MLFFIIQVLSDVEVTVGMDTENDERWPYAGTAAAVQSMGAKHFNRDVSVSYTTHYLLVMYHSIIVLV